MQLESFKSVSLNRTTRKSRQHVITLTHSRVQVSRGSCPSDCFATLISLVGYHLVPCYAYCVQAAAADASRSVSAGNSSVAPYTDDASTGPPKDTASSFSSSDIFPDGSQTPAHADPHIPLPAAVTLRTALQVRYCDWFALFSRVPCGSAVER